MTGGSNRGSRATGLAGFMAMTHGRLFPGARRYSIRHGTSGYRRGCRCLTCRRDESNRVRAFYEKSCDLCGGPTWGVRCAECVRRERKRRSVQPRGLHYQWGAP